MFQCPRWLPGPGWAPQCYWFQYWGWSRGGRATLPAAGAKTTGARPTAWAARGDTLHWTHKISKRGRKTSQITQSQVAQSQWQRGLEIIWPALSTRRVWKGSEQWARGRTPLGRWGGERGGYLAWSRRSNYSENPGERHRKMRRRAWRHSGIKSKARLQPWGGQNGYQSTEARERRQGWGFYMTHSNMHRVCRRRRRPGGWKPQSRSLRSTSRVS